MRAIEMANWEEAVVQMLDSKWAKQVGKRAEDLAFMMMTGSYRKE
jgi:lysozyme